MRIMSWNIQWGRGADGKVDVARTIAAIRAAGDLEVICLQEVAQGFPGLKGGHGEDVVALIAAAFPRHEVAFGPVLDVSTAAGRGRFGNLILSRPAIDQIYRHLLPCPADPSVPAMQRGCVEVVVQGRRGPLRIMTTHLEYYSARQRRAQIAALRALQREVSESASQPAAVKESNPAFAPRKRPVSVILCGDFNCVAAREDYRALAAPFERVEQGWVDAWTIAHPGLAHAPTVGLHGAEWPDHAYCCDFFWVTRDLAAYVAKVEVESDTAASDHQPVLLELDA